MPAGVEVRPIADLALDEAEPSMAKAHGGPLDAVVMIGHHARTLQRRTGSLLATPTIRSKERAWLSAD